MKTISQREMRNDCGAVLREVEAGESFTVTRRGVPVARLVPLDREPRGYRAPRRPAWFSVDELVDADVSVRVLVDEVREDR
ncbi:type II toxin-antitoxin system Phd/YefM family antitoxin [Tessaracoccus caeni]|uniref:type II toxin-antitoxin system Phd/YefM family antitoxin n=1 Tax=Tessaracoccus caeni TaxID=3031239 RepID=UPI0023DAE827|nr:type II toxin-antitoxin system prevent-host-death family antitoxin [Tessaracoccus caeni]MDF1488360.1 type II toxin-antitoxin system prevent-host-death family antitoxin [Tessaracoccus caeni]